MYDVRVWLAVSSLLLTHLVSLAGCTQVEAVGALRTPREPGTQDLKQPRCLMGQGPVRPSGHFPDLPLAVRGSNNPACSEHSALLEAAILNNTLWGVKMWESSAHVATGWTVGSGIYLGDFDGCFKSGAPFQEQFCLVHIHLAPEAIASHQLDPGLGKMMKWGLCVPASCSPEDLERSLGAAVKGGMTVSVAPTECDQSGKAQPSVKANATVLVLTLFLVALVTVATILDSRQDQQEKATPGLGKSVLLCFSARRNWQQLMCLDEVSPSHLPLHVFDAFRIFMTFFTVLAHVIVGMLLLPSSNPLDYREVMKRQQYNFISEAHLYVYTMFLVGGIVTSVVFYKSREKPIYIVMERFLRSVPMIILTLLVGLTFNSNINFGPLGGILRRRTLACENAWWLDLLFLTNYEVKPDVCLPQTWYLSVDFHMFVVSVVLVLPLLRYRRSVGTSVSALISLICIVVSFYQCYSNGWPQFVPVDVEYLRSPSYPREVLRRIAKTHYNAPCYLLGLCLGTWLVDNNKSENPVKLSKTGARLLKLLGVFICTTTVWLSAALRAGYGSAAHNAAFFALGRTTFCMGAALYFVAMMLRPHGGQSLLLKVLARLSLTVCLLHAPLLTAFLTYQRQTIYMNLSDMVMKALGIYCVTSAFGLLVHIMLEMPINNLRKVLFRKSKTD